MNTFSKHYIDLEPHRIEMTFAHLRMTLPDRIRKLISSIEACGQLTPVIVVPSATTTHFILIDGYLRIQALQKLRRDTVMAEVWECSESDALLSLFTNHGQRNWEAFEEAQVLRELQIRYHLSLEQIASRIGRTKSWVCRRLSLLETLSEQATQAITKGHISLWTASRVLAPLARANAIHADYLLEYLSQHSHSTREVAYFFKHYQKSNQASRQKMVMQPDLFFKVQNILQAEKQAKLLKSGPEGQWKSILAKISDHINYLEKLVPHLFYERQEEKVCHQLLEPLDRIQYMLNRISTTARRQQNDRQNDASNHSYAASVGKELSTH
jgi:ParB family transcriptional regulator, chromosome partitioning protein